MIHVRPAIERVCVACRKRYPREMLIRLTVDPESSIVFINEFARNEQKINGRSAYLCRSLNCSNIAMKGTRLKFALSGRSAKKIPKERQISWPLESQLINDIVSICTEPGKTCQNTRGKEA